MELATQQATQRTDHPAVAQAKRERPQVNLTEHTLTRPSATEPSELLQQSRRVHSRLYQCSLYIWAAAGSRYDCEGNSAKAVWLYVEYRDRTGASRYSQFALTSDSHLQAFVTHELPEASLHDIDPDVTRTNPVGAASVNDR